MIASFVIGIALLIFGLIAKYSFVKRNSLFGYRTYLSLKTEANWEFANKRFATHAILIGVVAMIIGSLNYLYKTGSNYSILFILSLLLFSIIRIEIGLQKFDKATR
jgi:uncharacterized membrane protein